MRKARITSRRSRMWISLRAARMRAAWYDRFYCSKNSHFKYNYWQNAGANMFLSDATIRDLKPKSKSYKKSDNGGLYVEVQASGRKLWRIAYRFNNKDKILRLPAYPVLSLADARAELQKVQNLLSRGIDPGRAKKQKYYFPPRLQEQLAKIHDYSLTVVEAPSGFGKTTAVREYLTSRVKKDKKSVLQWYTCLGESPGKVWAGICKLLSLLDDATGDALSNLGLPERESLPDVTALLQQYNPSKTVYLVVDNYQLSATAVQKALFLALAICRNKKLHIVVITQPLVIPPADGATTRYANAYHSILTEDFVFDNASIVAYCRMAGITLSAEETAQVQTASQGWIAAIRLQLKHFQNTGQFVGSSTIDTLVETAVWNNLSDRTKEFMLGVSLLDGATQRQAVIMNGGAAIPKEAYSLRAIDFFVHRVVGEKSVYFLHAILRDYLLEQLAGQSQAFVHSMLGRAATACLAEGDYYQAARFFIRVADYDSILAMPFTNQYFDNHQGEGIISFLFRLFQECPTETLLKHPLMVIALGIQFFKEGMQEGYLRAILLLEEFLKNPPGPPEMPKRELYRIKGEFEMMRFMLCYNDVMAMFEHYKKAREYLSNVSVPPRSRLFEGNVSWVAGIPSMLSAYWRQSGGLQATLAAMDEYLPFYTELVGGHGAGGDIAMRAEAAFAQGEDAEAEILCYKTICVAQNARQTSSRLCAELILARIGIVRCDEKLYATARKHIAREMELARQTAFTREGELCFAHLDMIFGQTADLPDWLRSLEDIQRTFYWLTQSHVIMLQCWMLLLEKRWAELYAVTEVTMATAYTLNHPLLQVYHLIFLTRAKLEEGHNAEAAAHLREALAIALPDRIYLPFAEHGRAILSLCEEVQNSFDGRRMRECLSLCRRWARGIAALCTDLPEGSRALTPRQLQFLSMAVEGNSNAQIAANCGVSVDTVNKTLRSAYVKLKVKNRTEAGAYYLRFIKK